MLTDSSREPLHPKDSQDGATRGAQFDISDHKLHLNGKAVEPDTKPSPSPVHFGDYDDSIHTHDSDEEEESQVDPADVIEEDWEEERQTRETWSGKMDFILSCIGYAVGLGNVWRFPYLCYNNGGGAFLVPYFTFLILCGMPLTMLELSIGQFVSLGPTALFQKFCPIFQGIGWAQVLISGVCCIYYNIIIAWTLYYLWKSCAAVLDGELPWASCGNWWNSDNCVQGMGHNLTVNESLAAAVAQTNETSKAATASEEFWVRYVLQLSSGIDNLQGVRPELAVALAVAWVMIFGCLFKGVKSSGRVVYVTATFPYVVLVILCIRGLTLPGAWSGIYFYLVPQWSKLLELKVWISAASQIFYSVGAAWGVMITFASFNKFSHNCYRDAILLPTINCFSSIFAGIVVFSIIGFMAHESGQTVDKVIQSGPGLAFIVYPEAVTKLPISPGWSILFFLMLLTIGLDSQFGMFETMITAFVDTWPKQLRARKTLFMGGVCVIMFFLGLPCVTNVSLLINSKDWGEFTKTMAVPAGSAGWRWAVPLKLQNLLRWRWRLPAGTAIIFGGMYVLQLMDWYLCTFALMIIGTLECLLVGWNYGWRRYLEDMKLMTRRRNIPKWWPLCWCFISPTVVTALLIASVAGHVPVTYAGYEYPTWALILGWFLAMVAVIPIPFYIFYNLVFKFKGSIVERVRESFRPAPDWGPSRLGDRVRFRKSMNTVPGRQAYVLGVERQETELVEIAKFHPSCADLSKFVDEAHETGVIIDTPVISHPRPKNISTKSGRRHSSKSHDGEHKKV